jgi:GT2 family glycosyltransferase
VTSTYNESPRLASWRRYYDLVAREIDLHIIVDNGSTPEHFREVRAAFPDSVVLRHPQNRGLIASLNSGFQYALDAGAECIGVWCNDFRLPEGVFRRLRDELEADPGLDGVMPVVLQGGTTDIVESLGAQLDTRRAALISNDTGAHWRPDWRGVRTVDMLHGGCHLLKRGVLEKIGLQDERLFMYADEIDFGWRAKRADLRFGVVLDALAWHEHVNAGGSTRPPMAAYLVSRNRMLIMRMHGRSGDLLRLAIRRNLTLIPAMVAYYRREGTVRHAWAHAAGLWHGIRGVTGPPPRSLFS